MAGRRWLMTLQEASQSPEQECGRGREDRLQGDRRLGLDPIGSIPL